MRKLRAVTAVLGVGVFLCLPVHAQNKKPAPKIGPSQHYVAPISRKTIGELCPNADRQFPELTGSLRPSFMNFWQTDYPTLVFDATDGSLHWLEPPMKTTDSVLYDLQPITFTPLTFVNEKVLVLICNEHFGATTTITPTNTLVTDSTASDIDLDSFTNAVVAQVTAATGQKTALMSLSNITLAEKTKQIEQLQTAPQCQALPGAQAKLESAIDALKTATAAMKVTLQDNNFSYPAPIDPQKWIAMIPTGLAADKDLHSNSRLYNDELRTVKIAAQSAGPIIASFNTVMGGKPWQDFKTAATAMKKAQEDYTKQLRDVTNRKLLCSTIPDSTQNEINAAATDYNNVKQYIDGTKASLGRVNTALIAANDQLVQWNLHSSVNSLSSLDAVTKNTLTRLTFQIADASDLAPAPVTKPADPAADSKKADASTKAQPAVSVVTTSDNVKPGGTLPPLATNPDAIAMIERHRIIHFVPTGGFLAVRAASNAYTVETYPTVTTVTTTVSTPSTSTTTVTIANTSGTASYAYAANGGSFQQAAIAGVTWYPLGRDSYPVTQLGKHVSIRSTTYAGYKDWTKFGIFMGTSVSSLGNFVITPTYEFFPGIEAFAGLTLVNKTSLLQGIIPCAGAGSSTTSLPTQTSTSTAAGVPTTTTIQTSTVSGCANSSATVLSGTSVPTNTELKPAFGLALCSIPTSLNTFSSGKS